MKTPLSIRRALGAIITVGLGLALLGCSSDSGANGGEPSAAGESSAAAPSTAEPSKLGPSAGDPSATADGATPSGTSTANPTSTSWVGEFAEPTNGNEITKGPWLAFAADANLQKVSFTYDADGYPTEVLMNTDSTAMVGLRAVPDNQDTAEMEKQILGGVTDGYVDEGSFLLLEDQEDLTAKYSLPTAVFTFTSTDATSDEIMTAVGAYIHAGAYAILATVAYVGGVVDTTVMQGWLENASIIDLASLSDQ
jgi:hypothetical protein